MTATGSTTGKPGCSATLLWRGACNHFVFMARYAAQLRLQGDPLGIASHPWQFWANIKTIPYFREAGSRPADMGIVLVVVGTVTIGLASSATDRRAQARG